MVVGLLEQMLWVQFIIMFMVILVQVQCWVSGVCWMCQSIQLISVISSICIKVSSSLFLLMFRVGIQWFWLMVVLLMLVIRFGMKIVSSLVMIISRMGSMLVQCQVGLCCSLVCLVCCLRFVGFDIIICFFFGYGVVVLGQFCQEILG